MSSRKMLGVVAVFYRSKNSASLRRGFGITHAEKLCFSKRALSI